MFPVVLALGGKPLPNHQVSMLLNSTATMHRPLFVLPSCPLLNWHAPTCTLTLTPNPNPSQQVAQQIRRQVVEATGLTCSCGVAANKMLAKVCSDIHKPDGQYVLANTREAVTHFIETLPVRKIPGIGAACYRGRQSATAAVKAGSMDSKFKFFSITDLCQNEPWKGRVTHVVSHVPSQLPELAVLGDYRIKSVLRKMTIRRVFHNALVCLTNQLYLCMST